MHLIVVIKLPQDLRQARVLLCELIKRAPRHHSAAVTQHHQLVGLAQELQLMRHKHNHLVTQQPVNALLKQQPPNLPHRFRKQSKATTRTHTRTHMCIQ